MKKPIKHRHRFKLICWTGGKPPIFKYRCACGEVTEREARDPAVARYLKQRIRADLRPAPEDDVHRAWRDFERKFIAADGFFKSHSYNLMRRIERWAEKQNAGDVRVISVDDACFAGSMLVLIEHRAQCSYMGTSVVYVPQCSGSPATFFLYPRHLKQLLSALGDVKHGAEPVEMEQRRRIRQEAAKLKRIAARVLTEGYEVEKKRNGRRK